MINMGDKLYIITRRDLNAGIQATQAIHCAFSFATEHNMQTINWMKHSNYLAFLSCANEQELIKLLDMAIAQNIKCSFFREEDLDNQITAIALECCDKSRKLCSSLPKALKEYK